MDSSIGLSRMGLRREKNETERANISKNTVLSTARSEIVDKIVFFRYARSSLDLEVHRERTHRNGHDGHVSSHRLFLLREDSRIRRHFDHFHSDRRGRLGPDRVSAR